MQISFYKTNYWVKFIDYPAAVDSTQKIYFASDFHLGAPNAFESLKREKAIISWLDFASRDATEIFLLGDVFDFWFEYKTVIPKGFSRLMGKLSALTDSGIPVHFFSGNHDMWGLDYFEEELGLIVHTKPIERVWNQKSFLIGHGDGLGPGDYTYKMIKSVFRSPAAQWLFSRIHPNTGITLANYWSSKSRISQGRTEEFLGNDQEWLVQFCVETLKKRNEAGLPNIDYFVFGHRHLPLDIPLMGGSRYINLGEWITYKSYGVFNGRDLQLEYWNAITEQDQPTPQGGGEA